MYNNISNDAKTALKSRVVTTTAKITLTSNNQVIDGNNLIDVTITDQCYENGVIVGTAMCKEVEIELIDNNYDLADKEFSLEVGILLPNNTYEYIPYGNFIVKDYQKVKSSNHYKLIAYDYMDKFNETFIDDNETLDDGATYVEPMTLQDFYEYVAAQYNVTIEMQANLPNANFSITTKPYFEGMSGRTVLSRIAEMMGCFAKINRNNKLEMKFKNITSETFSRDEMNTSLEIDNRFGPINVVSLRLSQIEGENVTKRDEESIEDYGETTLQISDNPFVYSEALRLLAINDIYEQVDGFSYYPTIFNGKLIYLDVGDEIQVQDMNSNTYYSTIILKQVLKIPATRKSKFENKALTDTGLKYQYTPEQVRKDRRTEYLVDKQNGIIKELVETTDTIEGQVNNITDTTNTAAGKYIYLNDSSDQPIIDIRLHGETSQATSTRGINYCPDINKWTLENGATISNGYIVLPSSGARATSPFIPIDKQQYFWCMYAKVFTNTANNRVYCQTFYYNENMENISGNGNAPIIDSTGIDNEYKWDFGGASGTVYGDALHDAKYIQIRFTYNNLYQIGEYKFKMPMVSSERQDTFIEYIPNSPSPDYPSPIVNVEGRNIASLETSETKTVGGVPFTVENGIININGTTSNGNFYFDTFRVKSGTATFWIEATGYTDKPNSNAFIILQESSDNSTWTSKSELSLLSTSTKQSQVTLDNSKYYRMRIYVAGNTFTNATIKVQLEYGSKTDFVPYNNIQIKKCNKNIASGKISNYALDGEGIFRSNTNYDMHIAKIFEGETYIVTTDESQLVCGFFINYPNIISSTYNNSRLVQSNKVFVAPISGYIAFRSLSGYEYAQLEHGSTATDYIAHEEQLYNFPLSEGQELMEGTYLADDGIHNVRKQIVLTGNETVVVYSSSTYAFAVYINTPIYYNTAETTVICNYLQATNANDLYEKRNTAGNNLIAANGWSTRYYLLVMINDYTTVDDIKNYLSTQYQAGTPVIVETQLAEEEIVPYTPEQQEAWNEITGMNTYMPVTHIYSDAYANIMYVRNNGLNIYETRDNAQRQYQTTTNKFAEQEITNESIISKVAEQETTIDTISGEVTSSTSRINTLEETVNGLSNTVYEKGGNNLFYYSKEFWTGQDVQKTVTRPIQVGDNLSGKTLTLSFSEGFSFGDTPNADIIVGTNNYRISSEQTSGATSTFQTITAKENDTFTQLYEYSVRDSLIVKNLTSFTLSNNFGTVSAINTNSPAYQYIQVQETVTENVLNIEEVNGGEFGTNSESGLGYIVGNGSSYQEINEIPNGAYTISFMYKKVGSALSEGSVKINDISYNLTETSWTKFTKTINVTTNSIKLEFIANTDNTLYIADLLANIGTQANSWTQNANEVRTDTVKIGRGIEISSSTQDTKFKADADGTRIVQASDESNVVAEFTKDGTRTKQLIVNEKAEISGLLIQQVGDQIWLSSLL